MDFLTSKQVDYLQWDNTISNDPYTPVYAYSWYLDVVANNWGGIVSSGYKSILPLAFRRKYNINYLYQPFFTRSMGVYGSNKDEAGTMKSLIAFSDKFKYWDFNIALKNTPVIEHANLSKRIFQVLELNKPYDELLKGYTGNTRRGIRDAMKENLSIVRSQDPERFVSQFKKYTSSRIKEFNQKDYSILAILLGKCIDNTESWHYSVFKGNDEISSVFFVKTGQCFTYIEGFNSPAGRELFSMHLLFDYFIREHASQNAIIDFGGSNVPSIAHFFHSFGAIDHNYYNIRLNKLPLMYRLFKK